MDFDQYQKALARADEFNKYLSQDETSASVERVDQALATTKIKFDGSSLSGGTRGNDAESKKRIGACREAYENVGIIGNIIDLMVDFALEGLTFEHKSPTIRNFYLNWGKAVNIHELSEEILKCLFRDANVPILSFRSEIDDREYTQYKKAVAEYDGKYYKAKGQSFKGSVFVDDTPLPKIIPARYAVLNVLKFYKSGSELLGTHGYEYQIASDDAATLKTPKTSDERKAADLLKRTLDDEAWKSLIERARLPLDPSRVDVLYFKKDSYQRWANPMLWRVIPDVQFKSLLRDMDISVAESVKSTLTIIKLGDTVNGFPPNRSLYRKFVSLLKKPTRSQIIVWNDLVKIESAYPPVDKILGKEKYEQVDNDIRSGLGVPEILVNGQGSNYSNSYLSVKTLLERLETGRKVLLRWIEKQSVLIAKAMGFQQPATVTMSHMSLVDDELEKELLLELFDRNMVSIETLLNRFGENFTVELQRHRREHKVVQAVQEEAPMAFLKVGKFGPSLQDVSLLDMAETEDVQEPTTPQEDRESPMEQEDEGDKGGRPRGTRKPQKGLKKVKPKGQAAASLDSIIVDEELYRRGRARFAALYKMFAKAYNDDPGPDDEAKIFGAIVHILCALQNHEDYTKNNIARALSDDYELATAPAKLDRCVREVTDKRVAEFRKKNDRAPNKKEMQDIVSSAWAICRKSLDM
jgi:hypothetical protein